ncbi:MAG TPA: endolytic transglycosylase MltG [Gammaproteobacteria bacterium]
MFRRLIILLPIILLAVAVFAAFTQYQRWQAAPLPLGADGETIHVPPGVALDALAEQLAADGVIEHAWDLKLLARLRGDAASVKAGEYELAPGLTLDGLLDKMVAGHVKLYALTIVEGITVVELLDQLAAHPAIRHTLDDDVSAVTLAKELGLPTDHAEGWFLPETWHFPRGTTDVAVLQRAHQAMREVLESAWAGRDDGLPIDSAYEALILASIIEKETAVESERTRIAGVFTRRLERGMRLQTDPTVIYGLGEKYTGDIRYRDLRTDTPYNTYTRSGLPPTPIALPGRESILAAVHPAEGDALYFVARGPGREHVFSATLEEHNRAVRKYQSERQPLETGQDDAT